jgi:hypothetical protein
MAPTKRPSTRLPTRMIPDRAQPVQPVVSSTDDETHEPSPYRPTFIDNDEQIQPTNNAVAYNRSEWHNLLAGDQLMPEIPEFVYDHNVPHDIPRDCSVDEDDHNGNNDDSETQPPEVPVDSGTQNTEELVHRVIDSSKVQTIGTYVN